MMMVGGEAWIVCLVESDLSARPRFDGSLGIWFGRSELHVRDVVDTIARLALTL